MLPELLGHLPALRSLFEGLDRDSTLDVENALEWVDLPAGEILFKQGDAAPDAYVVTAGHLAVVMGAGACRRTVARIGPGEVVGEMALLADAPRSATVLALHDSYLIRLPRRAFDVVMEGRPTRGDTSFASSRHVCSTPRRATRRRWSPRRSPSSRWGRSSR